MVLDGFAWQESIQTEYPEGALAGIVVMHSFRRHSVPDGNY